MFISLLYLHVHNQEVEYTLLKEHILISYAHTHSAISADFILLNLI